MFIISSWLKERDGRIDCNFLVKEDDLSFGSNNEIDHITTTKFANHPLNIYDLRDDLSF